MPHSKSDKGHFLPFLSFSSVSHKKVQDEKGFVNAESIVPIHTPRLTFLRKRALQINLPNDSTCTAVERRARRVWGRGRGPSAEGGT